MRIVTGIRPLGKFHIGNYLNTVKQYKELQEKNECIFFIADLHGLTTPFDSKTYSREVFDKAIEILASGLNPEKCIIYLQSTIKEVTELAWILSTVTPLGDLQRMTQFKEKSKKHIQNINAGLLNYPILMAADILIYQADLVPVGKDQEQHVELARTIARRFNKTFGQIFKEPEALILKSSAKIMSLQEPGKKMSKSDGPQTQINIFDEPEILKKKIMSAVTDTGKTIKYSPDAKPGISNLLTIYSLVSEKSIKETENKFKKKGYADFKKSLAELLIEKWEPMRRKRKELLAREDYMKEILDQGAKKARVLTQSTIEEVRKKTGLVQ
ncbi:MAG: tryptophan--tRNA ligase [Candidatus Nealsonbacteria bacterium]|nr:tryptophan--tRNA ligase [Candidatus Nealsonbacteria bacterium]